MLGVVYVGLFFLLDCCANKQAMAMSESGSGRNGTRSAQVKHPCAMQAGHESQQSRRPDCPHLSQMVATCSHVTLPRFQGRVVHAAGAFKRSQSAVAVAATKPLTNC